MEKGTRANSIQDENRESGVEVKGFSIFKLRLNLDIRALKIASRTNLELGPRFAEVRHELG